MLIRILAGAYGHRPDPEKSYIDRKDKDSEPFEVSDKEAERLIGLGIAEKAAVNIGIGSDKGASLTDLAKDDGLEQLTIQQLRKMAKDLGIPADGSKAALADKIRAANLKLQKEQDKDDDLPDENDEADMSSDNESPPFLQAAEPEV